MKHPQVKFFTLSSTILPILLFLSFEFIPLSPTFAAEPIDLRYNPTVLPTNSPQSLTAFPQTADPGQNSVSGFQQISKLIDTQGNTHIRLQQIYRGYPIIGAESLIHIAANGKITQNGTLFKTTDLDNELKNTPSIIFTKQQAEKATQYALSHYLQMSNQSGKVSPVHQSTQLVVYVDAKHKAHWSFKIKFNFYLKNALPANPIYLLDATTLEIYKQWNGVRSFEKVKGGGLGGNPTIGIMTYDGLAGHRPVLDMLRDSSKAVCYLQNDKVIIKDGRKAPIDEENGIMDDGILHHNIPILSFPCEKPDPIHENIYWDGSLDEINSAPSPGNDALYLAEQVDQMFFDWFNIHVLSDPLLNDQTMPIYVIVHAQTGGPIENSYSLGWWTDDATSIENGTVYLKKTEGDDSSFTYKLVTYEGNIIIDSIKAENMAPEEWSAILDSLRKRDGESFAFLNDKVKAEIFRLIVQKNYLPKYDSSIISNAEWDDATQAIYLGDQGIYNAADKKFNPSPMLSFSQGPAYPFAVSDVIAHELGHGFSSKHANLMSSLTEEQPGAIDESFSDMTAKAFEYYLTGKNSWTLGADTGQVTRYMDDPTKDCQTNQPRSCSIASMDKFTSSTEEHAAAGILNKAFYLLATSPGWNTRRAYEVMVRANRFYWVSSVKFQEAACGIWDAGKNLGLNDADRQSITVAMAAVGLTANNKQCVTPQPGELSTSPT